MWVNDVLCKALFIARGITWESNWKLSFFLSFVFCVPSERAWIQGSSRIISHHRLDHISSWRDPIPEGRRSADVSPPSALILQQSAVNRSANMAAKYFYLQGFLLLLFNFISTAALEKRFSDFKRCADEECSSKFASLLLKLAGFQGCTILIVQLAINCALSLDLLPIDTCDPGSIIYLSQKTCNRLMPFKNWKNMSRR